MQWELIRWGLLSKHTCVVSCSVTNWVLKKIKPRFLNLNRPRWSDHDFFFFFNVIFLVLSTFPLLWLEMMIILSFDCTMKAGYTFPVTSPYQAEAYDNLNRCPTVARHFLVQPWSLSIHREKSVPAVLCLFVSDYWMDVCI